MNLFQKYGIKEVADVVFYTINTIGDEEFYTPVLFLDTLKVSTLEKAAEKVEARGGKGNKKLITWNFGKEITLNLEDALFSPASMSMIWGGKLNAKMSDQVSAVVKGNLANKYYDSHYSVKAYPSPVLTDSEWEIIFNAADSVGYHSGIEKVGEEELSCYTHYIDRGEPEDEYVPQNRMSFIKQYFNRNRKTIPLMIDIPISGDDSFLKPEFSTEPKYFKNYAGEYTYTKKLVAMSISEYETNRILAIYNNLNEEKSQELAIVHLDYYYLKAKDSTTEGLYEWDNTNTLHGICNIIILVEKIENNLVILPYKSNSLIGDGYIMVNNITDNNWYDFIGLDSTANIAEQLQANLSINADELARIIQSSVFLENSRKDSPMPQEIILKIMSDINSLDKIGSLDTDIHDIEVIDRMEKCIVKDRKGLTISIQQQKDNLFRYYKDDKSSTYSIFYDAKTMLPLFPIEDGIIQENESDEFTIKMGTVYYKWTRTVSRSLADDSTLGKTLVIDAETFPDAYKIVGETYIRNQKTGKDQRYQFTIHRANVSTDTSVTLEAEGDPTTFSMQIDVLTPPNDVMMELKQYDVEDDMIEGGTRIVPQKSKYTYTPANIEYVEEVADKNEEIY